MNTSAPNALIFGAAGGIGAALSRRLREKGWNLALASRDTSGALTALCEDIDATALRSDVTDLASVEAAFGAAQEKFGRIDGVVNCVGSLLLKPAHLTSADEWAHTIAANLTSSFNILRTAAGRMMRSGGGSIVLMSSAVAQRGMINHEAIAAAKAGVVGLAQSAAATYARYNVRVNCVAPGLTRTPLTTTLTTNDASLKASTALHPLGRIGEPRDIASAIAWLLDPEQSWVTAQDLAVDGGLSSVQPRLATA
ncbi:MAG: SDR family oxidoreductase [Planctomycetaceae bacterium]|nr:SDR family oxidoreductase [Planctomycetaceae bacterium]